LERLLKDRHNKGWPRVEVKTFIVETEQSWRYCIEPMGYRDVIWERSGYVELIVWKRLMVKEILKESTPQNLTA
jgi:hypothetical protein